MKESPLKTSLKLILYYIFLVIFVTSFVSLLYTFYEMCRNLVSGEELKSLDLNYFVYGIFLLFPIVLMVSGIFMGMYLIRHSSRSWLPILTYIVLYLFSWIVLMPFNFNMYTTYSDSSIFQREEAQLSSGYFRKTGEGIIYYSDIDSENVGSGVFIDVSDDSSTVYVFSDKKLPENRAFADELVKDNIQLPLFMSIVSVWFAAIIQAANRAYSDGFFSWMTFLSLGFALTSVVGVRHISKWRLINVHLLIICSFGIIAFNVWNFHPNFLDPVKDLFLKMFSGLPGIKNPFLLVVNALTTVCLSLVGLCIDIKRKGEVVADEEV